MDVLCDQKDTVDVFIRDREVLLSPARKIPPEILSDIFMWCFAGDRLASTKDMPIVLSQVCSYWRSCAISTPNLWSSLKLHANSTNAQSIAWLVDTALSRSGTCPLTIDFTMFDDFGDLDDACLDVILNHSRRWKSMCFQLTSPSLRKFSVVKNALPLLEMLNICDASGFYAILDAFEVAPRLRSLLTEMSPDILKVPAEQLESFTWLGGRGNECIDWLHRCSNLVECTIHSGGESGTWLPPSIMAHFPRLIKLEIEGWGHKAEILGNLFNALIAPVLSDLRIQLYADSPQWAQPPFISFLRRSCALRKMVLGNIPTTDFQLIEILRMLPSLVELIISHHRLTPLPITNTLQQLTYRPPNLRSMPLLNPQLQSIIFRGNFEMDGQIFGDMVASRWRLHESMGADDLTFEITRLKAVTWNLRGSLDGETRDRLEKFREEGLEVDIS